MTQRTKQEPIRAAQGFPAIASWVSAVAGLHVILAFASLAQPTAARAEESQGGGVFRAPWSGELLGTGARAPTAEEQAWSERNMVRTERVRWNALGLARVNQARRARGLRGLDAAAYAPAPLGDEVVGAKPDRSTPTEPPSTIVVPATVDNSTTKYFPPIRSQGSLNSCAQFSAIYYTFTHMTALARDWDAKAGGDAFRFSPKWTYNMVNSGQNSGSSLYGAYAIARAHGAASWADFPYDADYRAWCLDPHAWFFALCHRADQVGRVTGVNTDAGLNQLKQLLVNGYVLNFATYISSWVWQPVANDPATPADDAYAGRNCAVAVSGNLGGHAMTVVGYSDDLWVDINGNGSVDAGEKGALRVANSWGTGWNEGGYCWVAYQALRTRNGTDSTGGLFWFDEANWITARPDYLPTLVAEFTLNHAKRGQIEMAYGIGGATSTAPSAWKYPESVLYYAGGQFAFDGTTTARDGTFLFDLTDLVPQTGGSNRYFLRVLDATFGDPATLQACRLLDTRHGNTVVVTDAARVTDGPYTPLIVSAVYDANAGSAAPTALASADVTGGDLPVTVTFDGTASSDPDGSLVSYAWTFGDGASASGPVVTHTYTQAGVWTTTLTVTDSDGARATSTVTVTVTDPNVLNAPASLTATSLKGAVALGWSDLSTNESGFYVERAVKVGKTYGAFQRVASVAANVRNYTDAVASGSYQYRVQAFNASTGKVSAYSNTASARVK